MDLRQQRGLLIAKAKRVRSNGSTFFVPSQTGSGIYTVDLAAGTCTCLDHETRGVHCKHQWAVEYARGIIAMPDGGEVTMEVMRVTYAQDWPRYHRAQCAEKATVQVLLRQLCESIVQPPYRGRGRPPLPLADVVYGATMKVYTGMSGRRATTDIRECEARGHVDRAPSYNAIFAAMQRPELTPILTSMVETSAAPLAAIERSFSLDATGFATSTYARWYDEKYGRDRRTQHWVKAHAMVGNQTNIITAILVTDGAHHDAPELPGLLERTAERFTIEKVQGDKAYLSHVNLEAIERIGAVPFIPFRSNSTPTGSTQGRSKGSEAWTRMWHMFSAHREEFLASYHQRSNSESTFSAIKRMFGGSVRSKKHAAQVNEVLAKALCYNLSRVTHAIYELGIATRFGSQE